MKRSLLNLACGLMLVFGAASTATAGGLNTPVPTPLRMQQPLKPTKRVLKAPAVSSPSQFLKAQNAEGEFDGPHHSPEAAEAF